MSEPEASSPEAVLQSMQELVKSQQQLTQAISQQTEALSHLVAVNQEILSLLIEDMDMDPDASLDGG